MIIYFVALAIVALVYWYWSMPKNLPPGPIGLPFIGIVLDFLDCSKQHLVLQRYAKKYGPVYSFYLINKLFIVVADYESIHEAYVKRGDVINGFVLPHDSPQFVGIATMDGERWKYLRRLELSFLSDITLRRPILDHILQEEADNLVQALIDQSGSSFDPKRTLIQAVLNVLFKITFGRSCTNEAIVDLFLFDAEQESNLIGSTLSPIEVPTALTHFRCFLSSDSETRQANDYSRSLLEKELLETKSAFDPNVEPTNYVHTFMKEQMNKGKDQEHLNETNLFLTSAMDIIFGGADSPNAILHHTLKHLMIHPQIQDRIAEETRYNLTSPDASVVYSDRKKLPYLEATVMESLRVCDVAPLGMPHRASAPTKLFGYDVPKDTVVLPLLTTVLKNPDRYPEPDTFDPARFLDENGSFTRDPQVIPFLIGKRMCVGDTVSKRMFFSFIGTICSRLILECSPGHPKPNMEPRVIVMNPGNTTVARNYEMCVKLRKQ